MSSEMPQLDAIAAAMGKGWVHNKVQQTGYCHYLTNGQQKIQFMYVSNSGRKKVSASVCFPYHTAKNSHYCKIGLSINRHPRALAADIKRRLLPGYAENLQACIDEHHANKNKREMDHFIIETFKKIIPMQYQHGSGHYFGDSYGNLAKGWLKQNLHRGDEITLELHCLNPEQVCQILALIKPDIMKGLEAKEERKRNADAIRESVAARRAKRKKAAA